jgi:lipopolysaccharide export system permease protein
MKKLDIYIIKKFLGTFFYAISLLVIVVIVIDITEKIDDFLEKKAPLYEIIFVYYVNFIPYFVNLFLYLFTFIAVIFFTSRMATNTEFVAILSSGVSFKRLLFPYILSAFILSLLSFYLANWLIPQTSEKRREFINTYVEKLSKDKDRNIHIQLDPNTFIYVDNYNSSTNIGYNFSIERFNDAHMYYQMHANQIKWDTAHNQWTIKNYIIRKMDGLEENLIKGAILDTTINLTPSDFIIHENSYELMNYSQLNDYIKKEKQKGASNLQFYEVEKHKRFAYPFATIILTVIGISLSSRKVKGGIGLHLGFGIAISFAFILFMQISTVFATYGNLAPVIAVWIPNIIFGILAIYLLRIAPK